MKKKTKTKQQKQQNKTTKSTQKSQKQRFPYLSRLKIKNKTSDTKDVINILKFYYGRNKLHLNRKYGHITRDIFFKGSIKVKNTKNEFDFNVKV